MQQQQQQAPDQQWQKRRYLLKIKDNNPPTYTPNWAGVPRAGIETPSESPQEKAARYDALLRQAEHDMQQKLGSAGFVHMLAICSRAPNSLQLVIELPPALLAYVTPINLIEAVMDCENQQRVKHTSYGATLVAAPKADASDSKPKGFIPAF